MTEQDTGRDYFVVYGVRYVSQTKLDAALARAEAAEARVRELQAHTMTARPIDLAVIQSGLRQMAALIAAGEGLRHVALWHNPMCDATYTDGDRECSCGLVSAVIAWDKAKAGEGQGQ